MGLDMFLFKHKKFRDNDEKFNELVRQDEKRNPLLEKKQIWFALGL